MPTYRDLLNAIQAANALQDSAAAASSNPKRWDGTTEEREAAEREFYTADRALDATIIELEK